MGPQLPPAPPLWQVQLEPMPGECVVCRQSGDAEHGRLLWLAHMQCCGTLAAALHVPRAWDAPLDQPGGAESTFVGPWSAEERWQRHGCMYGDVDWLPGVHITCCGHMMHEKCLQDYRCGMAGPRSGVVMRMGRMGGGEQMLPPGAGCFVREPLLSPCTPPSWHPPSVSSSIHIPCVSPTCSRVSGIAIPWQ